jgi:hypothetical protein
MSGGLSQAEQFFSFGKLVPTCRQYLVLTANDASEKGCRFLGRTRFISDIFAADSVEIKQREDLFGNVLLKMS